MGLCAALLCVASNEQANIGTAGCLHCTTADGGALPAVDVSSSSTSMWLFFWHRVFGSNAVRGVHPRRFCMGHCQRTERCQGQPHHSNWMVPCAVEWQSECAMVTLLLRKDSCVRQAVIACVRLAPPPWHRLHKHTAHHHHQRSLAPHPFACC
jgi:hypothetical protein